MIRRFAIIIPVALALFAFAAGDAKAQPDIKVSGVINGVINLGSVEEGAVVRGSFDVKNNGSEPLFVSSVQPQCSCVKIIYPSQSLSILPQESEKIIFEFNSTGYSGLTREFIFLKTNDPFNKFFNVTIEADVGRKPAQVEDRFLSFSPVFIAGAGFVDGINPCAFTVIVFFMSFLVFAGYKRLQMVLLGSAFILAVFITYVLIGLGIFSALKHFSAFFHLSRALYLFTALIAFVLGILSLVDFIKVRRSKNPDDVVLKLPDWLKARIHRAISASLGQRNKGLRSKWGLLAAAFSTGILVSILESACTGQMYLPTIVFMLKNSALKIRALFYLLLYNVMFIFPLIIVFLLALYGVSSEKFGRLVKTNLVRVKLLTALVFLTLAILLLLAF